jgi:hypothetical protein
MKTVNDFIENDKALVITAIFGITMYSVYVFGIEAKEIVTNAFSGLFGVAIGRALTARK